MYDSMLESWKQSFSIFLPGNFLAFSKEALSCAWRGYKVWIRYFWWLLLLILGVYAYFFLNLEILLADESKLYALDIALVNLHQLLVFVTLVAVCGKPITGFIQFIKNYWKPFLFLFILFFFFELFSRSLLTFLMKQEGLNIPYVIKTWSFIAQAFIKQFFFLVWIFFLLDSKVRIKDLGISFVNTLKLVIRTLPAVVLLVFALLLPIWIVQRLYIWYYFGALYHGGVLSGLYQYVGLFINIPIRYPLYLLPIQYGFFAAFYDRFKAFG